MVVAPASGEACANQSLTEISGTMKGQAAC